MDAKQKVNNTTFWNSHISYNTDKMVQTSVNHTSRKRSSSARRSQVNGDKNSNMKVVVRVRPANNMEIAKQSSTSVRVMDERMLVFDPKDDSIDYLSSNRRRKQPQFLTRRARDLRFMFDRVFDHVSSNRDVFEHTTKTIVEGVLGGYNCTVFAYGATGAGKTFTMLGDQSNPGVMFLTMMELYSRINACKDEKISDVAVSYLEVTSFVRKKFSKTCSQFESNFFLDPELYDIIIHHLLLPN